MGLTQEEKEGMNALRLQTKLDIFLSLRMQVVTL